MSFDFSSMSFAKSAVGLLKHKDMMYVRKDSMERMGAAYMANGIVTLAGSRLYTSMADTPEIIDEALNRFEEVFSHVKKRPTRACCPDLQICEKPPPAVTAGGGAVIFVYMPKYSRLARELRMAYQTSEASTAAGITSGHGYGRKGVSRSSLSSMHTPYPMVMTAMTASGGII